MTLDDYFGENGAFKEASDTYRNRHHMLPSWLLREAAALGDPKDIGYTMGYAFALVLRRRRLTITPEVLLQIAQNKFPLGGPEPFLDGYARFGEKQNDTPAGEK